MSELAVVVDRERAESATDALIEEGVYDDTRSIQPHGEGIAIPVTAAPERTEVHEVLEVDLPARNRDLKDALASRGWSETECARAPASWAVIGSCILLQDGDIPRPQELGEVLLELHGEADTVLVSHGISGDQRDPDIEVIAGLGDTEVIHTEHGTKYALDLAEVMFSPGNQAERARMREVVTPDERVFDMFAGIGYFTLPMARAGADVTAVEINPVAYRYLVENAVLNDVQDTISAFRADCRDVEVSADRVVMGHYDAPEYLDTALDALEADGIVHVHATVPEAELWAVPTDAIESAAEERGRRVDILDERVVKSHAPGVNHVVVDAQIH